MQVYGALVGMIVGALYNLLGYFKHTDGRVYNPRLLIRAVLIGIGVGVIASFKGWDVRSPEAWAWSGAEVSGITVLVDWLLKILFEHKK